jgi:hypothetical protein
MTDRIETLNQDGQPPGKILSRILCVHTVRIKGALTALKLFSCLVNLKDLTTV